MFFFLILPSLSPSSLKFSHSSIQHLPIPLALLMESRHPRRRSLASLPDGVLLMVAMHVASSSPKPFADIGNLKLSTFRQVTSDRMVERCIAVDREYDRMTWGGLERKERYIAFVRRCSDAGNSEANCILGVVAASTQKDFDAHVPNYPNLPSKLICLLHNVTLHADAETDEVYAQMTLQPVNSYDEKALLVSDLALKPSTPQTEFFCKTLTASDTSTHGGFSIPRRAAEKIFPPLDFSMQPPARELQARDLHDNVWTFRHIYRGQPKRHLLTTCWGLFVSGKRLFAGDSVLFVRDEKQQLLLGIRRANRQPTNISSSVLSSDSMHIGILAAAAHAAANNSPFTVFYNPRASPSEFVIPLAKYQKAAYGNQISLGMRFRMMFETEDSGTRRYMGTITGISDLDPMRWKNSQWRNLQVGWDESAAGERRTRVSLWEIEPVAASFFICPPPFFRSKRLRQPGLEDEEASEMEDLFKRAMPWLGEEICIKDSHSQNGIMPGLSLAQWMNMQQNPSLTNSSMQTDYMRSLTGSVVQNLGASDLSRQLGLQAQLLQPNNIQFNVPRLPQQNQQVDQFPKVSQLGSVTSQQQLLQDITVQQRQLLVNQGTPLNHNQNQTNRMQPQTLVLAQVQHQQPVMQNQQVQINLQSTHMQQQLLLQQQQQIQQQQQNRMPQFSNQANQQLQLPDQQIQLQSLRRLQQQQQQSLSQSSIHLPQEPLSQSSIQLPQVPLSQSSMQLIQVPQIHEQLRTLTEATHHFSSTNPLCHQQVVFQQCTKATSSEMHLPQSSQQQSQQKHHQHHQQQVLLPELPGTTLSTSPTNLISENGSSLLVAAGAQSVLTDDIPSRSTSPSTNNSLFLPVVNKTHHRSTVPTDTSSQPTGKLINSRSFDALKAGPIAAKDFSNFEHNVEHSIPIPKVQSQGGITRHADISNTAQLDYLDTSSSATSLCLSQTDGSLQTTLPLSFNQPPAFRDAPSDNEVQGTDPRNNVLFGVNIDDPLDIPLTTSPLLASNMYSGKYQDHISGNVVADYNTSKDAQHELSSSMVSQSFCVPDMAFNSIDSTMNESNFLNKNSWAPAPQFQLMRTYTKVYKRGAVGRSIDITRYSGYEELKYDLAHRFSIEGQLEDRQRIGWKLVYVDHENDVLLVGDDPWEEFVSCVRCIRILSPQEVQQMSLDGDFGNNILTNQACSSSDGGNAWRGQCDQNSGNRSAGSYDNLD